MYNDMFRLNYGVHAQLTVAGDWKQQELLNAICLPLLYVTG